MSVLFHMSKEISGRGSTILIPPRCLPRFLHVIAGGRGLLQPETNRPNDRVPDCLLGLRLVRVGQEPGIDLWVVDELHFQQAQRGIAHVRILPGISEDSEPILAVLGIFHNQPLLRFSSKRLQPQRDFICNHLAEAFVPVGIRIREMHVFPIRMLCRTEIHPRPFGFSIRRIEVNAEQNVGTLADCDRRALHGAQMNV